MFKFTDYLFEIFTVAKKRDVDVSEAFLRFKADVASGEAHDYNTGDALPGFDFTAAKAEWDKLGEEGQKQAIEDYDAFIDDHYREACDAFAEGREAVDALVRKVTV